MNKRQIIGFSVVMVIVGFLIGTLATVKTIFGKLEITKSIPEQRREMQTEYFTDGFNTGYERGDSAGFRRCYNNRQDFPFYTPEESSKF